MLVFNFERRSFKLINKLITHIFDVIAAGRKILPNFHRASK